MLEGRAEVQRAYEGMASRGIVEHVGEKHLGRFRAVRYPEKDHAPEEALLKKIQATLTGALSDPEAAASKVTDSEAEAVDTAASDSAAGDSGAAEAKAPGAAEPAPAKPGAQAPDARTTALIALLQAAGLLGKLFPAADLTLASELSRDYWPSRAVEDELRMIRLAQQESANL